ncbi:MAG: cell division protein FtsZ [archaeon]
MISEVRRALDNFERKVPQKVPGCVTDEELKAMLQQSNAKIKVIGTGGSGNNTLRRIFEIGIKDVETIAVNTDAQHLLITPADKKVLIGKQLTRGLGAGANPELGEAAARENIDDISNVIGDSNLVFIACGLGGGTGTGSAPIIAQTAKEKGALTIAVVTLPFSSEGKRRMNNALEGLKNLKKASDAVIVVPNDKLLELVPELPLNAAFKVADEILANAVKGITELITKPGLVNLDFADIKAILSNSGTVMIGLGESSSESSETRALEAIEEAINSPLLDVDISNADKALINVVGGPDMTLKEAELICEAVASKINDKANIIWGALVDEELPRNTIHTMVLIAGGKIPYLEPLENGIDLDVVGEIDAKNG